MRKNKLIEARKERHLSQAQLAGMINMDQSQYQRRESGSIKISDDEWDRLAVALDKMREDIYEEDMPLIVNRDNTNSAISYSGTINYYSIPDFMMDNTQELISRLKAENQELRNRIEELERQKK